MQLTNLIPDADILLSLSPEELSGYVLEYFHKCGDPEKFTEHRANFTSERFLRGYDPKMYKDCQKVLMEAWSCLEREGFIAPEPENTAPVYFLTRRGRSIRSKEAFDTFMHASLFPKDSIHRALQGTVYPLFLRGQYETAVFQAFKSVEVSVRDASGPGYSQAYGVDLMRKAFHPERGPLTDKVEPVAEREALQALFAGSIGRFKNPSSHRHVPISDPSETIEMIQLVSHLLRVVDSRKEQII